MDKADIEGWCRIEDSKINGSLSAQYLECRRSLDLSEASLETPLHNQTDDYIALNLSGVQVKRGLSMPRTYVNGGIDLSLASCDILDDAQSGWMCGNDQNQSNSSNNSHNVNLHGFQYRLFANASAYDATSSKDSVFTVRKSWLKRSPDKVNCFNPQPWRQAASVLNSMGYEQVSRKLSIERRTQERKAKNASLMTKVQGWFLYWLAEYGFNPWKTLAWSLAVIFLFGFVFNMYPEAFAQVRYGDLIQPSLEGQNQYPTFNGFLYSLDTFVPIIDLGFETYWRADTSKSSTSLTFNLGSVLAILFVLERLIGAVLVALTITGFTGFLSRDEQ